MLIKREILDDIQSGAASTAGSVIDEIHHQLKIGERVFVQEFDGSKSLLEYGKEGKFKTTPIAPKPGDG